MKSLPQKSSKANSLGFLAGVIFGWLTARKPAVTPSDVRKADFSTSSQKMGLRFTDRIRTMFRFRWLRGKN